MRKGEMDSKVIIYALIIILALLFILFSLTSIGKFNKRQREIMIDQLESDIRGAVDEIEFGSVKDERFTVPDGVDLICFFDLRDAKRSYLLNSPILKKFPAILSSLKSGERKNMFLMSGREIEDKRYVGDVCFSDYPFYECFRPKENYLDLSIEGGAYCALIVADFRACWNIGNKLDDNNVTQYEINLFSRFLDFTIPRGTYIKDINDNKEICLEQIPPPEHMDENRIEALASEVYQITPVIAGLDKISTLTADYVGEALPPKTIEEYIKLEHYDSAWAKPGGSEEEQEIDTKFYKTKSENVDSLGLYAVFGPVPPKAVISVDAKSGKSKYYKNINEQIVFSGELSTDSDGNNDIVSYEWDLGDGSDPVTLMTIPYTYTEFGSYTVTLRVTDKEGYAGIASVNISIVNFNNNKSELARNAIFMIPKKNPVSDDMNLRNIRQVLPLSTPNIYFSGDKDDPYPLIVYDGDITEVDISELKSRYPGKSIYDFGHGTLPDGGPDISSVDLPPDTGEYLDFWQKYEDLIIVSERLSETDARSFLDKASLYASFINAPLIYSDQDPEDYLTGVKRVRIFGDAEVSIPAGIDVRHYDDENDVPQISANIKERVIPP